MFSGQGSHYYHMGRALFEHNQVFRGWMERLDAVAESLVGQSVIDILYSDNHKTADPFDNILYTSPAIVMVEYALCQVLTEYGLEPDYVLGASFGELAATAVAKMITIEELLYYIVNFIKEFESKAVRGRMLGILDNQRLYHNTPVLRQNSEIAAVNFDHHFVVSCTMEGANEIEDFLKTRKISYQILPVSYAFHSALMEPAETVCNKVLRQVNLSPPQIPFISATYAGLIQSFPENYVWEILRKPIRFQKTVEELEKKGDYCYIDLGPSGTLSTFVKYILKSDSRSCFFPTLTPFGQELKNIENLKKEIPTPQKAKKGRMEDTKMLTVVFPGQGSQKKGMGESLFDDFPQLTSRADAILGYSIKSLCLDDPDNLLGQTQYTQPAIYVVSALAYLKRSDESKTKPDFLAGHSLGEYTALFAAGAFDFETGLKLVRKRGELMARATGGGMAAVIGLLPDEIFEVLSRNGLSDIAVANYNTPSQTVISGLRKDIDRAQPVFEKVKKGVLYIPLKVSGAFHSRFMEPARQEFSGYLDSFEFSELALPVVSNVTARPYLAGRIKENLIRQLTSSVQWTDSIRYLMGKGTMIFEEVGPGKVLTGMIRKIEKEAEPLVLETEDPAGTGEAATIDRSVPESTDNKIVAGDNGVDPQAGPGEASVSAGRLDDNRQCFNITAASLGSESFKKDYNLKYAYVTGGMYHGIASTGLVAKIARAGMLGFFGTGALALDEIEAAIQKLKTELDNGQPYGMNLLNSPMEEATVDLYLKHNVKIIEAAAYMQVTPALVRYRLHGAKTNGNGSVSVANRILAKVSRPEVAEAFLSPAPDRIVEKLLAVGLITAEEAKLSRQLPMADDLIVEADSGGHTDQGRAYTLMPVMIRLRDEMKNKYQYSRKIHVGAAGGIGSPEAAAAAFILGADFLLTGSINQCTVEAGTSPLVKDLLQTINVQDTAYAPAGDMFEYGAKVQVLRKGVFFPARANKLFTLYQMYNSLDEIDEKTQNQLQEKYFKKRFDEIFDDCIAYYPECEIQKAESNPKHKMAMIFKWYFGLSTRLALSGDEERKVDFQVHTGPALGAFNQWVKGTPLENWRARHVDQIAEKLMQETAAVLNDRFRMFI